MTKKALASSILPKSVINNLNRTLEPYLSQRLNKSGICAIKTSRERRQLYLLAMAQLWQLGFRIRAPQSLAAKHVVALMRHWHEQGISAATLHTRLSMLRGLCSWLSKRDVVSDDITDYVPDEAAQRKTVVTESKAWEAHGIDPHEMIELALRIDERFGLMLAVQWAFGLRVKESIEIRPCKALVDSDSTLEIYEGTKGGRVRRIPIETKYQRDILEHARMVAAKGNTGRLRWTDCTWRQAQNRFYHYVRRRLGLTKAMLGITCHGLRHSFAQREYRGLTGLPTPVEGGALGRIDRRTHQSACLTVSRRLGHGRIDVTTAYYGSYGHALRVAPTDMTFVLKQRTTYV